jgi:hypothetical protein
MTGRMVPTTLKFTRFESQPSQKLKTVKKKPWISIEIMANEFV